MNFLTKINYMKYAKVWIAVSILLTLVGLTVVFTKGFNTGIDFTGGHMFGIQFEQTVTQAQVREVSAKAIGRDDITIQTVEAKGEATGSEFIIRTPELNEEQRAAFTKELEQVGAYKLISEDQVSASVSSELATTALLALGIAAAMQIAYLTFRFQFKMGITAVIALLHDLVITIGLVAIFQVQINSAFVAAILTILGYSMNDTVVVYDRIRENLATRKKTESLQDLATRSIQEVITRSVLTGVCVQVTLLALLIWGGDTIWDMAMTLFIGITSGMYSSIFIAAALWLFWQKAEEASGKPAAGAKHKPAKA